MKMIKLAAYIASATMLTACFDDSDDDGVSVPAINMEKVQLVVNTNADIALAAYKDSLATAQDLKTALNTFATTSNATNLEAAKKAWLISREPYGQTEVYRFRPTPIEDNLSTTEGEDGPEGALNAWPLGEALIDYVKTGSDFGTAEIGVESHGVPAPQSGSALPAAIDTANASASAASNGNTIIGNRDITIDASLLETSESGAGNDVISGYHAIEFLLWGQDLNESGNVTTDVSRDEAIKTNNFNHGGQRPLTDFTSDANADRRHAFLAVAADKLIADLTQVVNQWTTGTANSYYDAFTTLSSEADAKQKLTEILTGMGTLSEGELAGERMQIAFSANSQEDEHSCFSDNTHRDIWLNAEGVSNSYFGQYTGYDADLDPSTVDVTSSGVSAVDGYGIYDYLQDVGLDSLATTTKTALETTETNYTAIDTDARNNKPFDVLIMDVNRTADSSVAKTIISLNAQATSIQDAANALGLGTVVDAEASACDTTTPDVEC